MKYLNSPYNFLQGLCSRDVQVYYDMFRNADYVNSMTGGESHGLNEDWRSANDQNYVVGPAQKSDDPSCIFSAAKDILTGHQQGPFCSGHAATLGQLLDQHARTVPHVSREKYGKIVGAAGAAGYWT
jgi:hypothetical protein